MSKAVGPIPKLGRPSNLDTQNIRLRPVGHRLLIAPDPVEEARHGDIVLVQQTTDADALAQVYATVLAVGPDCWKDLGGVTKDWWDERTDIHVSVSDGPAWCKPGDRILYDRYCTRKIPGKDGKFREDVVILNDLDVSAVLEGDIGPDLPEHLAEYLHA